MAASYDAIIIGAGHNGLVTACYLARAGWKVLVLERRYVVGGACVTEEVFPGYKVSTAAYVNSLFRKEIIRDLRLADYGFAVLERNPSSFTPFPDGRSLLMGPDMDATQRAIARFSVRDAENYPKYNAMLERVAGVIEPTLLLRPPNLLRPGLRDLWRMFRLGRSLQKMGPGLSEAVEVLTGAARPILDRWFESEEVKATLATDAIIGAMAAPSMPGTAYVLFHHVMGETNGKRGVWAYVKGGMGGLTLALAAAAKAMGVEIRTETAVARILVQDGTATGVALADGTEVRGQSGGQQCRSERDLQQAHGQSPAAAGLCRGGQPDQLRQRLAQDQRGVVGIAAFHRLPRADARARSTAAPSISVPTRITSSELMTTPSMAGPRNGPSSSAPSPRWSIRPWRRPAST